MSVPAQLLTVSELNRFVKSLLEYDVGVVTVEGEISNFTVPSSGHFYFTLKDSTAQIRCVFFKNRHKPPFSQQLSNGVKVIVSGRLSLYEARGDYQLIAEGISESGMGDLFQEFEALKKKLAAEGLFSSERKKQLPQIPETIGIITSPTGAAIQDMLATLNKRFPLAKILIFATEVQGATAPKQIIYALELAAQHSCDVLILARGGGSIEDLWAFNNEALARVIASSKIPVISGVGHETDFTIADFVADYRAETPTAAAIAATPSQEDLLNYIHSLQERLLQSMQRQTEVLSIRLKHLSEKIASPKTAIYSYWQSIDYLERQLIVFMRHFLDKKQNQQQRIDSQLYSLNPMIQIKYWSEKTVYIQQQLIHFMKACLEGQQTRLTKQLSTLHVVSPLATLERGYAIATHNHTIIIDSQSLACGDSINVRFLKGSVACRVTTVEE